MLQRAKSEGRTPPEHILELIRVDLGIPEMSLILTSWWFYLGLFAGSIAALLAVYFFLALETILRPGANCADTIGEEDRRT